LKRVTLHIKAGKTTDDELVAELAEFSQALVIVNSRRHARALYEKAKTTGLDGLVHLTTRQTAADRRRILETIRSDLQGGVACRVIATSLVEAGVDVDFPTVWRAMAGLDQIAQAAGRCNREGKRSVETSIVTVFEPAMAEPPREIKAFAEAMRRIAPKHQDLFSPEAIKDYFEEVYWQRGEDELDRIIVKRPGAPTKGVSVFNSFSVSAGQTDFAYRTVGENFRLVDSGMEPVIIAIDDAAKAALAGLRGDWLKPSTAARRLQNFVVQVPPKDRQKLITSGHVAFADSAGQFAVLVTESFYTREVGLTWEDADGLGAEDLII
jgi:CRISPR-associated endonuclease/helicase Cas3